MLYTEEEQELRFYEQADGRKVCKLHDGRIALVHYDQVDKVEDGELWRVRLQHQSTFAIAWPIENLDHAPPASAPKTMRRRRATTEIIRAPTETKAPVVAVDIVAVEPEPAPTQLLAEAAPARRSLVGATDRVAVFVDAANLDLACRNAGYWIDYSKLLKFCRGDGTVHGAYYFVADFTQDDDKNQRGFLDALNGQGYVIRLKRVKRIIDRESGVERVKANVDTELVIEMLNTVDNYDVAYLVSGDSDFERLVDILRSRGKRIYVLTSRAVLARELAYVADQPVHFLEDLQDALEK